MKITDGKEYKCFQIPVQLTDDELLRRLGGPKEPIEEGGVVEGNYHLRNRINRFSAKRNENIDGYLRFQKKDGVIYCYNLSKKNGEYLPITLRKNFEIDQVNSLLYYAGKGVYGLAMGLNAFAAVISILRFASDVTVM